MGIKGLMKLLAEEAPGCYRKGTPSNYTGRVVAIDASMQLYQFMSMVRSGSSNGTNLGQSLLTNEKGEVTSHILGFFHRTISLMEKGLKPVYVFDGKPPELKSGELQKRKEAKAKVREDIKELEKKVQEGDVEAVEELKKMQKRDLSVTKEHNLDVQKLLQHMGVPIVLAPCEAEAQCAELCKKNKVFATATEDMDALTFETPVLLRNLTYSPSRKLDVLEIHHAKILGELKITAAQFIDLCILCGCDYSPSIRGIGPKGALKLIRAHGSLEKILEVVDRKKFSVPPELDNNLEAIREMFVKAEVTPAEEIEPFVWKQPNDEDVVSYLVGEKQFDEVRVRAGLKRLNKSRSQTAQKRMDSFFKPKTDGATPFKRKKSTTAKGVKKRR